MDEHSQTKDSLDYALDAVATLIMDFGPWNPAMKMDAKGFNEAIKAISYLKSFKAEPCDKNCLLFNKTCSAILAAIDYYKSFNVSVFASLNGKPVSDFTIKTGTMKVGSKKETAVEYWMALIDDKKKPADIKVSGATLAKLPKCARALLKELAHQKKIAENIKKLAAKMK